MASIYKNPNLRQRSMTEADLFAAIATIAATEDNLQRILQAALEYLREVITFTGGSVALVEGEELVIYAADGPFADSARGYHMPRNGGASWHVIETGQPFLSNDLHQDHRRATGGFRSYLAVPLSWRGRVVGLLEIDSTSAHAFTTADVQLLQKIGTLLGGPMALAQQVQDLRIEIAEHKRTEQRLAVQYAITTMLAEAQNFPQIAPKILESIATILGWDLGCVWCIDRDAGMLRCSAIWQRDSLYASEFQAQTQQMSAAPQVGLPGRVWASGQPHWIADLLEDPVIPRRSAAAQAGLRSAFAFPICGNDEIFGTFEFFSREPRQPDDELLRTAAALGRQIGQFIDRRRAETARQRAEAAQRFLVESSSVLGSSLDYELTLQSVAHLTIPFLADWCIVDLLQDDGSLRMTAVAHLDPSKEWIAHQMRQQYPPNNEEHTIWRVIRGGQSIVTSEVADDGLVRMAKDAGHLELLRAMAIRSSLVVPLIARDRTLGAISLISAQPGRYRQEDLALAEDLAHRAALALDNARLYREAQAAIEMRNEFLSIASHELKTPLTTLLGHTQGLQRRLARNPTLGERDHRAIDVIERQALRLNKQIDTLLDLSRIETGQFKLDCESLDLTALAWRIVSELEPTLERHTLHTTIQEAPLLVEADATRMEQVLQNLLQNAIKYSPSGGVVTLGIEQQDNLAVITVSDQGVGIPEAERTYLFQRFYRASNVTGRNISGMSIGLYLVNLIVTLHHGAIEYTSVENQGSTFTVRLPRYVA